MDSNRRAFLKTVAAFCLAPVLIPAAQSNAKVKIRCHGYRIDPKNCTECGNCLPECSVSAIEPKMTDQGLIYTIDFKKCIGVRCQKCRMVCPTPGAIQCVVFS